MDISHMEEFNCCANMKALVTKLPYKLRKRWRQIACDIQEQQNRKVIFKDLDGFIRRQAKIAVHLIFGDIRIAIYLTTDYTKISTTILQQQ